MSNIYAEYKSGRVLYLYTKLMHGEHIHKSDEAKRFEVSPRSIQRDIDDLRTFFENQAAEGLTNQELVYDKSEDCYLLRAREDLTLSNSEILAVCKILLESRALRRDEMEPIIQKLVNACVPQKNRAIVQSLLANEMFHYVEPHHRKQFVSNLWDIGIAVQEHRVMQITYEKQDGTIVDRTIQPVGIMFSEYYFYLTAFLENIDKQTKFTNPDDLFPTIYRIDRIRERRIQVTGKVYAATRTGKLHVNSEDSIVIGGEVIASEDHDDCVSLMRKLPEQGFVCVADGVGGYTGGAIASNFVLQALADNENTQPELLRPFLTRVHQNLLDYASSVPELHMMSTTMTGIFFYDSKCYCVHAGNTRAYHYHGGYLEQLTTDHTVYQELLEQGYYYEALICNKNIITASFGGAPEMIHRLTVFECPPFETLLLTTDGIVTAYVVRIFYKNGLF